MTTLIEPTQTVDQKLDDLTQLIGDLHTQLTEERQRRARYEELIADALPMLRTLSEDAAEQLDELSKKGYFEFAKASAGVVDEVIANFSDDDVRQLGDNVVLILETIKEMTQPEVLGALHRMIEAIEHQDLALEDESAEPPGLWQLIRKTRDPGVRRGIARALNTLAAVNESNKPTGSGGI